jgi:hypothetical protein
MALYKVVLEVEMETYAHTSEGAKRQARMALRFNSEIATYDPYKVVVRDAQEVGRGAQ